MKSSQYCYRGKRLSSSLACLCWARQLLLHTLRIQIHRILKTSIWKIELLRKLQEDGANWSTISSKRAFLSSETTGMPLKIMSVRELHSKFATIAWKPMTVLTSLIYSLERATLQAYLKLLSLCNRKHLCPALTTTFETSSLCAPNSSSFTKSPAKRILMQSSNNSYMNRFNQSIE